MLLFGICILAFWPVYFSKLAQTRFMIHLHSLLGMIWIVMLFMQSWLARKRSYKAHRSIGRVSYGIVFLFVITAFMLFHNFLNTHNPFTEAFGARIFLYDFTGIVFLSLAYLFAVTIYKKKSKIHSRLMISTIILMSFPIISRLFLFYGDFGLTTGQSLELSIYILDFTVLAMIIYEKMKGKIYPIYPILLIYMVFQHIGYVYSDKWDGLQFFMSWYAGL